MYMVVRHRDNVGPDRHGVDSQWTVILLTSNKTLAETVMFQERNNKYFYDNQYMSVDIVEVEPERKYDVFEEVEVANSFFIAEDK